MWNKSEIAEPVDGPGREMIAGGSLSIKIIKTVLGGTNIIGKIQYHADTNTNLFRKKEIRRRKARFENQITKKI